MLLSRSFESQPPSSPLRKFVTLHVPILLCLYILTDNETHYTAEGAVPTTKRHLAVFTALARHAGSMRVFRGLTAIAILGFCSSFALYKMESIFGRDILDELFFSTPYTLVDSEDDTNGGPKGGGYEYELANVEEEDEDDNDDGFDGDDDEEDNVHDNNGNKKGKQKRQTDVNDDERPYKFDEVVDENETIYAKTQSPALIICNMSLNLLFYILVSLFLFTVSSGGRKYIDQTSGAKAIVNATDQSVLKRLGDIASPIFPLVLFFICAVKTIFPWTQRRYYFWTIVSYTIGAPVYDVSFRDGFIGDIFTSMVRPMQDIAYTFFYFCSGLQGWWIYRDNTDMDHPSGIESSWLLHTVVLPACTVSPLWWRFCQCLRQSYDSKNRWPYLGNAAKYFCAAQVAMFGVFDPQKRGSVIWIIAFVCATLYQLWWDVFMDWELLVWVPNMNSADAGTCTGIFNGHFQLRDNRLYKHKSLYIFIFVANTILRFFWALNVMPSRYLSPSGALLDTFSADFSTFIVPFLACAEIIRRSLWGLLRVELEVLKRVAETEKVTDTKAYQLDPDSNGHTRTDKEMEPMMMNNNKKNPAVTLGSNLDGSADLTFQSNTASTVDETKFLWELCAYATVFTGMGVLAAIHRQVL